MTEEIVRQPEPRTFAQGTSAKELALLDSIGCGDRAAFEELYRLYHPRLTSFLMRMVRRPQLVEEVLNDTMMVVWQRPDSFHGGSKLSTWIMAIAYRKALKGLKRQDDPVEDDDGHERVSEEVSPETIVRGPSAATIVGKGDGGTVAGAPCGRRSHLLPRTGL